MKKCTNCLEEKIESDFAWRLRKEKKKHSRCKACMSLYFKSINKKRYEKNKAKYAERNKKRRIAYKQFIYSYLSDKQCEFCGYKDTIYALQFDHIDVRTKTFCVSKMVSNLAPLDRIKQEIKKCRILCANCHANRTAAQFNWYHSIIK